MSLQVYNKKKIPAKDRAKVSPIKITKDPLALRIDKLEKLVAELVHKN